MWDGQLGSFLKFYDELAHLSGGRAHVAKEKSVLRKYLKIIRALDDINDDSNSAVIHQEHFLEVQHSGADNCFQYHCY